MNRAIVRDRSSLPVISRRIELISPEEIASAIMMVAEGSHGIQFEEIPAEVGRMLGFGRTSEDTRIAVDSETKKLIESGKLEFRGSTLIRVQAWG
ncbi:MAG: hypothetical protein M3Y27_08155 [Acidobacteriota bacterium]|nr:hypothetical protein [Acidobacteriota bacterium]